MEIEWRPNGNYIETNWKPSGTKWNQMEASWKPNGNHVETIQKPIRKCN